MNISGHAFFVLPVSLTSNLQPLVHSKLKCHRYSSSEIRWLEWGSGVPWTS